MIYGIGTDIIEISRIEKAIQKKSFMQNIFTKNEIQYFYDKGSLSATFCAKEATAKAIGTGFRGFSPIDIEVIHNENNKPFINISSKLQCILKQMDILNYQFHVSLSHCQTYATAFVILCNTPKGFYILL